MSWSSGIQVSAPTLTVWENLHKTKIGHAKDFSGNSIRPNCTICMEPCVIGGIRLTCSHLFHYDCFAKLTRSNLGASRAARCPQCRTLPGQKSIFETKKSPRQGAGGRRTKAKKREACGVVSSSSNNNVPESSRGGPAKLRWETYKIRNEEAKTREWKKEYGKKYQSVPNKLRMRRLRAKEFTDCRPQGVRQGFIKKKSKYIAHHTNYERAKYKSKLELRESTIKPTRIDRDLLAEMRRDSQRRMVKVRRMGRKQINIPDEAKPNDPWRACKTDPDIKLMKL
uniref:RING-type domain-containing protein n=1 Tax=Lotharella globosa TaxID=91324 RepID=A0A7S3Z3R9_9EUKA|mmetsp:Transcript_12542/g.25546  ORF Transcript_12542/g.25546 Transcript_12542/m.25546 type:complete len:282 (-) Transcript_12542:399-1244(-)|eukprot:CAMPEP_0167827192 /NCGR_PEP_ID=MMETSP0112_2-20121227/10546_1 /TAXON_ID=91324 /ORGANISM="Lotharella globosa, Strain CCCM811" /LENGTH=281 /DNA_ID=CAMNT_0007729905 /DNA_START=344 /DNA_END=1189 /DNA_ORIENTATION=-